MEGSAGNRAFELRQKRHGVPALLSFFIPGLGQLIKGDFLIGFLVWVAMGIAAISCLAYVGFVLVPVFWIIQVYDAYSGPDAATKRELKRLAALAVLLLCASPMIGCGQDPIASAASPDGGAAAVVPICGGFPGYSVTMNDCGGKMADGLRCVRDCTWQLGSDPSAEIADAGRITVEPGCTTPSGDGGLVLCVFDCLACH